MVSNRAVSFSNFLCFMLVSGECLAFAIFRTVVKLINYATLFMFCKKKHSMSSSVLPFTECVYQYLKKELFNICRRQIKKGPLCISNHILIIPETDLTHERFLTYSKANMFVNHVIQLPVHRKEHSWNS